MIGVISYTGNKQKLLPDLLPLFPTADRFVDAFCGGLSVSLSQNGKVLSNDIQTPLINLYRALQETSLNDIIDFINAHKVTKTDKDGYLRLRSLYNETKDPLLILVLQYSSFSNMIRFNDKTGEFTAPFGHREFNNNSFKRLQHFKAKSSNVEFVSLPFNELDIADGDFVYCDPPYLITCADYNKYWSVDEEMKLLTWLDDLNRQGIKFGLSNVIEHHGKSNDLLKAWMAQYTVHELSKNYVFNIHHAKEKGGTREVYVTNV